MAIANAILKVGPAPKKRPASRDPRREALHQRIDSMSSEALDVLLREIARADGEGWIDQQLPPTLFARKTVATMTLPIPPSSNDLWVVRAGYSKTTRKPIGWLQRSSEFETYRNTAATIARKYGVRPAGGELAIRMRVYRPRRCGDLDNYHAALQDALNGIAWRDDSQIAGIEATRHDDPGNPRAEVEIRAI